MCDVIIDVLRVLHLAFINGDKLLGMQFLLRLAAIDVVVISLLMATVSTYTWSFSVNMFRFIYVIDSV